MSVLAVSGQQSAVSDGRRWLALAVIALAQLMVALDATIVNVALPSAQRTLHFSDADRQWVTTAYTLVFAGFVLLGGKVADLVGRKKTLLVGLAGVSAVAGAANGIGVLAGARALQGLFAAVLAPTTLSLLAVLFRDPKERAKAFAVFGAIAGSGAAVGLVLGGALAEYLDEHQPAAREPVAEDSAAEQEQHQWQDPRRHHIAEVGDRAATLQHGERQGHGGRRRAQQRRRVPEKEDPEVAYAQH
jgi:MFS family permease